VTRAEFIEVVSQDPALSAPIKQAATSIPSRQFVFGVDDAAILLFMYPIVVLVLREIGLPWLHEVGRYSDLWRLKVGRWIDEQYRAEGFDPDQVETAAEALRRELERTTGLDRRDAWERLAQRLAAPSKDNDTVPGK
jgi:predicted phosphoribosyltransferase